MIEDNLAPLATIDKETGEPPESRVRNAAGVRQRVNEMRQAESTRSLRRAKVEALLDGVAPYSKKQLKDLNRGNDANINLRTGEGMAEAAKTPYYDLDFETPRPVDIEIEYGDDTAKNYEWSETISNGLGRMLRRWSGNDGNTQLLQWNMVVHGVGTSVWADTVDWRWKSRPLGDVLVPDDAEADIDELDECAIPRTYLPGELYQLIKNESAAKTRGWNIDLARKAIINAAPNDFRRTHGNNWESYQSAIRTGDVAWANKSNRILVVDHFIKEFDGKITHTILLDDGTPQTGTLPSPKDDFLFKKERRFSRFSEVICPFFFDVTKAGLWHEVKGLGPKIFDICGMENRLTCRMIDQAMAGVIAVPKTAEDLQKMELVQAGPVTWFPAGTEFQATKLSDSLESSMLIKRDLQGSLQSNTSQYRQRVTAENQEPTLGQAQMNAQQNAVMTKGAVNRYYTAKDRQYREIVRRVFNPRLSKSDPGGDEALEFRDWCISRGVPEEALKFENVCDVRAVRLIGYGSPAMREVVSNKLFMLAPAMDERSKRNALRTGLAPYVGQAHVDAFFPPFDEADVPNDHVWGATIENYVLRSAQDENAVVRLITPKQDHVIHFDNHYGDTQQHVQEMQAGKANPMEVALHLHNAGINMRQHLNAMMADPTRKADLAPREDAWQQLSKIADQLKQQIEESLKSQEANAQPQVDPDLMAKMLKVRLDAGIKREKMMGDHQLKVEKQTFASRMKDLQASADERRKNFAAMGEAQRKAAAAQPELAAVA